MVKWKIVFTKNAFKDAVKIEKSGYKTKVEELLLILKHDPYQSPPPYKKLVGDLKGAYSRRINIQHRLVYEVMESEKVVKVLSMWTLCE